MKKILFTLLLSAFSVGAMAQGVSMEMFQMNRQINQLAQASDAAAFKQAADDFLVAAKKAQETMPNSLDGDQERFKGYQKGMQDVIDAVNQAKQLAEQGNLANAKDVVQQLNKLKKTYHAEYK